MFGHPALRQLIVLKFKGGIRLQKRRLKQPKHWVFLGLGVILSVLWGGSFFGGTMQASSRLTSDWLYLSTRAGILVLAVLTVIGSFSHRGLYLPKEELELCFSGPLSRSHLIRYRLSINLLKSLFAGVLFGCVAAWRMPVAAFAFCGVLVTMLTVPILGQATALLLGDAENRLGKIGSKFPLRAITLVLFIALAIGIVQAAVGNQEKLKGLFGANGLAVGQIAGNSVVHAILLPFEPWARMITARTALEFFPWFAFAILFWFASFELTSRIRVDFRELSLATSADIARRLNRMRRGAFSAGQSRISKRTLGWNVPWILGRGSFGAVAWLKLTSIVRKARGTMGLSLVIILFIGVLATGIAHNRTVEDLLAGSALICGMGTLYLCAGLRFDFRNDLELMESIKSWPLRPWALFLATLLPEVLLVALLLGFVILARAVYLQVFHPALLGVLAFQPLFTLTWVALDNGVFLFSPLRYTPGEEGALQHMGRSMVLMLLRFVVLLLVAVAAGGPAFLTWLLVEKGFGASHTAALWAAGTSGWFGLLAVDIGLVALGGVMLKRFDIARDKAL